MCVPPSGQELSAGPLEWVWSHEVQGFASKPGPFLMSQRLGRGKRTRLFKENPPGLLWKI